MAIISEAGHMEIFKKLFSFASGIRNEYRDEKNKNRRDSYPIGLTKSSIARASKDLVMSFPILCTDTIQISTASMISKAHERNCTTMLQQLFSSVNLTGNDGIEALQKWHKNFDNNMSMDEYMDAMDALSVTVKNTWDNRDVYKARLNEMAEDMVKECKNNNQYFPESSFSKSSILNFALESSKYDGSLSVIKEDSMDGNFYTDDDMVYDPVDDTYKTFNQFRVDDAVRKNQYTATRNAQEDQKQRDTKDNWDRQYKFEKKKFKQQQKQQKKQLDFEKDKFDAQQQQNLILNKRAEDQFDLQKQQFDLQKQQYDRQMDKDKFDMNMRTMTDRRELFQKQLLDSDIKKCNELVPTMMIVRYLAPDPYGNSTITNEFIAGVKTRLVSCSSLEIIDRIKSIQKNKANLLNLVRATTKEISFCKDFIAGIEQAKIDAKQNSSLSKNSAIWRSLQARSTKSGLNRLKKNRANDAGAITTLVISDEEVNYMKKVEGIDMNNPSVAKSVMEAYNLMAIVIVDEQVEVAKFLYDGDRYFQEFAFNTLERETGDNSYKKVVNLLSKTIR